MKVDLIYKWPDAVLLRFFQISNSLKFKDFVNINSKEKCKYNNLIVNDLGNSKEILLELFNSRRISFFKLEVGRTK